MKKALPSAQWEVTIGDEKGNLLFGDEKMQIYSLEFCVTSSNFPFLDLGDDLLFKSKDNSGKTSLAIR